MTRVNQSPNTTRVDTVSIASRLETRSRLALVSDSITVVDASPPLELFDSLLHAARLYSTSTLC